jgi:hypothetical protein
MRSERIRCGRGFDPVISYRSAPLCCSQPEGRPRWFTSLFRSAWKLRSVCGRSDTHPNLRTSDIAEACLSETKAVKSDVSLNGVWRTAVTTSSGAARGSP